MSLIINPFAHAAAGPSPLLDDLVAYWKLDEASGTREDSVGSNDLADNNTVTSDNGKVGDAAEFVAANVEYLSIADNADLSMGDIDFTVACWINFSTAGASQKCIVGKWNISGQEYLIIDDSGEIEFWVHDGSSTKRSLSGVTPSTSTWYFVVAWHDATENTVNIQVNNDTPVSVPHSTGVTNGTSQFRIGNAIEGTNLPFDGRVDEVGIWKRVLTSDERTELYNAGSGKTYPFD